MKARVFVTLKPSVFDPQGRAIVDALQSLGYGSVGDVRQGKYFELDLNVSGADEAEALAAEVASRVLSNPVIESFRIEIVRFAAAGGPVLGICNGFQILLECGLLPGAMLRNRDLKFHCEFVGIRVEQTNTPFTSLCTVGQVLRVPIAHGEGNYYAPAET